METMETTKNNNMKKSTKISRLLRCMANVNVMKLLKTIQKPVGVSIKKASENLKLPRKKPNMMMHFILQKMDNLVSKTKRL